MSKEKNPTIKDVAAAVDELAVMISKGFAGVDERFEKVDHRLDKLEKGQKALFEVVKDFSPKKLNKLEDTVDNHERRLKKLELKAA